MNTNKITCNTKDVEELVDKIQHIFQDKLGNPADAAQACEQSMLTLSALKMCEIHIKRRLESDFGMTVEIHVSGKLKAGEPLEAVQASIPDMGKEEVN